jgi:flagellin-specific chaperone FliS
MMLALHSPNEAYRRVDFDARVAGADAQELVSMCFEQLAGSLGTALAAAERGDNTLKSHSLTRALSAVLALQMGVSGEAPVAGALRLFYEAARRTLLDNAIAFDEERLAILRRDVLEIGAAIRSA